MSALSLEPALLALASAGALAESSTRWRNGVCIVVPNRSSGATADDVVLWLRAQGWAGHVVHSLACGPCACVWRRGTGS